MLIKTLLIATTNSDKMREISAMLCAADMADIKLLDLTAYGAYIPPEENGASFADNACIKALAAANYSRHLTLADDSGLMVVALDGAPGVYSARYADSGHDDAANNAKLLSQLAYTPTEQRQAAFYCAIALALPNGKLWLTEGQVEGVILKAPRGIGGFGYDPLFYLPDYKLTMAELSQNEKNRISHRALALKKAISLIKNLDTL